MMMTLETNHRPTSTPLDVKLLATRFKLLNALLTPTLAVFRRISDRQDRIQHRLNELGFPDETACRKWRRGQARKQSKKARTAR
jgi:hypothetical protein